MLMLIHIENVFAKSGKKTEEAPIGWTLDGRAFIIRSKDELVQNWLPQFFRHGKFQSFTRKLYRWGFRQVNLPRDASQEKRELVFANPQFQREKRSLMAHMKSVTAAGVRRQQKEQQISESKLSDKDEATSREGLLSLGPPNFVDVILANQARQPIPQPAPLGLPTLSFGAIGGSSNAISQMHQLLDPVTRHLLLGQPRLERGPSLMDLYQQQIPQQVRLPSAASFNLHQASADRLTLPPNFLAQPQVASSPLQNLLDASVTPSASTGLESFSRDGAVQERLRELAEQLLRGNRSPPGPPSGPQL